MGDGNTKLMKNTSCLLSKNSFPLYHLKLIRNIRHADVPNKMDVQIHPFKDPISRGGGPPDCLIAKVVDLSNQFLLLSAPYFCIYIFSSPIPYEAKQ